MKGKNALDPLEVYLRDIKRYPLLERSGEQELARRIQFSDDQEARHILITSNLRLVVYFARRYPWFIQDSIQVGNIALMRAVDLFEPGYPGRFSDYATPGIKRGINRAVNESRIVHVPENVLDLLFKISSTRRRLGKELGRRPTLGRIAAELDEPVERLRQALVNGSRKRTAIDSGAKRGADGTIEDPLADDPSNAAGHNIAREHLDRMLQTLTERDRSIFEKRYGYEDGRFQSQKEIGDAFGLTRAGISLILIGLKKWVKNHSDAQLLEDL